MLFHQLVDLLTSLTAPTFFDPPHVFRGSRSSDDDDTATQEARPEWDFVGVGRDDGQKGGEFNPIFYRRKLWRLLEHQTKWLSPRPRERGWDAGSNRIVEIARFEHRETGAVIVVMNTHLDHSGVVARREAARMLYTYAEEVTKFASTERSTSLPLLLSGDLNSNSQGDAYKIMNGPVGQDVRNLFRQESLYGDEMTFTGFMGREKDLDRIDYIFAHSSLAFLVQDQWIPRMYAVLPNKFDDGIYLSDHRAVVADLELNRLDGKTTVV